MSRTREELGNELKELLGSKNTYFQPPESTKLTLPCFLYDMTSIFTSYADNNPYHNKKRYTITYVTKNPDEGMNMCDKMLGHFRTCRFDRHYTSGNNHHYVFNLYY